MSKNKSRNKTTRPAKAAGTSRRKAAKAAKAAAGAVDVLFSAPTLLDYARDAWNRADWPALADLADHPLEDEAERARLALLIAAGLAQQDRFDTAQRFARQALDWGASERLAAQVLISGVYTTLGRAALAQGHAEEAPALFRAALLDMEPDEDRRQAAAERRLDAERHRLAGTPPPFPPPSPPPSPPQAGPAGPDALVRMASEVQTLRAELQAVRKSRGAARAALPRAEVVPPFVVVVAGVPRSGSTWLYNAVRMLCAEADLSCYSAWYKDYDPAAGQGQLLHLVKLHEHRHLTFPHHRILTTRRDLAERLGSLVRMGWLAAKKSEIRQQAQRYADLDVQWSEHSDFEVDFAAIEATPADLLRRIAAELDIPCDTARAERIATALQTMPAPDKTQGTFGHDAETLLHPGHRASDAEREASLALVRSALADMHFELHDQG